MLLQVTVNKQFGQLQKSFVNGFYDNFKWKAFEIVLDSSDSLKISQIGLKYYNL